MIPLLGVVDVVVWPIPVTSLPLLRELVPDLK